MSLSDNLTTVFAPTQRSIEHEDWIHKETAINITQGKRSLILPAMFFECPACGLFSKETIHHSAYYKTSEFEYQRMHIVCKYCDNRIIEFFVHVAGNSRFSTTVPDIDHVREGFVF